MRTGRRHQLFSRPTCRTEIRTQAPLCRIDGTLNIDDIKHFLCEINYIP
jgi:hypothetical protein